MIIPDSPRDLGLPYDTWRPGQKLAIRTGLHAKTKHVVIQAPTGSGKTLIGQAIAALDGRRHVTLTATKSLEDQYVHTGFDLADVRGMSNYPCHAARSQFAAHFRGRRGTIMCDEGPCRAGLSCGLKDSGCDYFDARRSMMASSNGLTNYSYHMAMRRYGGGLGPIHRLLCDEAHAEPDEIMSACRIEIPLNLIEGNPPRTAKRWIAWAASKLEALKPQGDADDDSRIRRQRLVDELERLTRIDGTWAWDAGRDSVQFEPTIPKHLLGALCGDQIASVVHLSATITPGTLRLMGIPDDDVTFQIMASRFPVERRPVYVVKTCRVDYRMTTDMVAWWIARMDKIMAARRDRKGIIHTVSYARAQQIANASRERSRFIVPTSGRELKQALDYFRDQRPSSGAVLLSPSVTTGLDFPMQDAEYQIIAKMPFPDTRSAIMKARIQHTPGYRDHVWTQSLVQACGRLNRSELDQGETFICDDHAKWALRHAYRQHLLAAWFWDAVTFVKNAPAPPPPLRVAA